MPVDVDKVIGAELPGSTYTWTEDDIILYHLGIGAGVPPTDPGELHYVYEGGDLHVLPTFATIPPFGVMMSFAGINGVEIDLAQVLHGEQETILHHPIPTNGTVIQQGRVVDVYDKGKGALAIVEIESQAEESGQPLFTNRSSIYVRGEGSFGGDSGPPPAHRAPDRDPDFVVSSPTLPQQALLYRMSSGDKNPLHADPAFAALAGFERPILHGLCTYGIVAKAAIGAVLDGDPAAVASYGARFSGVLFPGDTVVTRIWKENGGYLIAADCKEKGTPVLSNGYLIPR